MRNLFLLALLLRPLSGFADSPGIKGNLCPTGPQQYAIGIKSSGILTCIPGSSGSGITSLNGLTGAVQTFARPGSTGTAPAWVSSGTVHTLNLPLASVSSVNAGLISKTEYDTFNMKESALSFTAPLIRTTNTLSCRVATGSLSGCLAAADFAAFSAKAPLASPTFTGTVNVTDLTAAGKIKGSLYTSGNAAVVVPDDDTLYDEAGIVSVEWGTRQLNFSDGNFALDWGTPGSLLLGGQFTYGNYHVEPSEHNAGNSSTAVTIDLSTGSAQKVTLTGNTTFTLTNPQTGGAYVIRIATGAGSFTVTWPGTVKWSGGTAPTITATASKVDLINLYWDGTSYYGSFSQNY